MLHLRTIPDVCLGPVRTELLDGEQVMKLRMVERDVGRAIIPLKRLAGNEDGLGPVGEPAGALTRSGHRLQESRRVEWGWRSRCGARH